MKKTIVSALALSLLAIVSPGVQEKDAPRPEGGKPAPAFRLNDHTGRAVSPLVQEEDAALWTVLAFYPKAMTPG